MEKENIYTHFAGRLSFPLIQMSGFVLMFLGGYLVSALNFYGLIALSIGLSLFFSRMGLQIDFANKTHREFFGLFGYKYGKWKALPNIEYVTLFNEQYSQRASVVTIDNTQKFSKFKLSLIVSKNEKYDAGLFTDKIKALNAGKHIAQNLNTKLLDYTGKEPEWVKI